MLKVNYWTDFTWQELFNERWQEKPDAVGWGISERGENKWKSMVADKSFKKLGSKEE